MSFDKQRALRTTQILLMTIGGAGLAGYVAAFHLPMLLISTGLLSGTWALLYNFLGRIN